MSPNNVNMTFLTIREDDDVHILWVSEFIELWVLSFWYFQTGLLRKQEPATKVKHHNEKQNVILYSLLLTSEKESISEPVE